LPYSDIAREYLLREGISPDRVVKTGSPMNEVLSHYREQIDGSDVLARFDLSAQGYFVVSCHREENVDDAEQSRQLAGMLNGLAVEFGMPVIVSTHPRTRKRLDVLGVELKPEISLLKPLGFFDYVHLQMNAKAVLSDSGTITEESSILNFPALNIRQAHERPEGMEEGAVMLTGLHWERILQALAILETQPRGAVRSQRLVENYAPANVSDKVLRIILSYTDYVNRVVWRKPV
jgi:UDP-N-acetylglucosamine 2-epimerase (non-hydrolysing)